MKSYCAEVIDGFGLSSKEPKIGSTAFDTSKDQWLIFDGNNWIVIEDVENIGKQPKLKKKSKLKKIKKRFGEETRNLDI